MSTPPCIDAAGHAVAKGHCYRCGLILGKKARIALGGEVVLIRGKHLGRAQRQAPSSEKGVAYIKRLLKLQDGCCYYCRRPLAAELAVREHKIPRSRGGGAGKNLVAACVTCDHEKGNHTPEEWTNRWYEQDQALLGTDTGADRTRSLNKIGRKKPDYTKARKDLYDPFSKDTSWNWENKQRDQYFHEER